MIFGGRAMSTKVHPLHASSWLRAAAYQGGALALLKADGEVILHIDVPARELGLLIAADRRRAMGHKTSPGRAYNRLVRRHPVASAKVPEYAALLREIGPLMRAAMAR